MKYHKYSVLTVGTCPRITLAVVARTKDQCVLLIYDAIPSRFIPSLRKSACSSRVTTPDTPIPV